MGKVADKVVAIEIDKTLIPILRETLGEFDNIEVVNQDILKVDVEELVKEKLHLGHIKPSQSPWNTPIFVIKKKIRQMEAPA